MDTLRIWERRYAIVTPVRDDRGRLYSEADVRRLQLLAAAVSRGHAIGRLARLSDPEIEAMLSAVPPRPAAPQSADDALATTGTVTAGVMSALRQYDAAGLDRELNRLVLAMPPREFVHRVVLPSMREVGNEWEAGRLTPGQEHLLSAALRNILGAMIRMSGREHVSRRLLFATPSGERHEFGILAAAMLAALAGLGVVYLGPDLPGAQIADAAVHVGAQVVVIGLVDGSARAETMDDVRAVAERLPASIELWLGGRVSADAVRALGTPRLLLLPDFLALEAHLARIGGTS